MLNSKVFITNPQSLVNQLNECLQDESNKVVQIKRMETVPISSSKVMTVLVYDNESDNFLDGAKQYLNTQFEILNNASTDEPIKEEKEE